MAEKTDMTSLKNAFIIALHTYIQLFGLLIGIFILMNTDEWQAALLSIIGFMAYAIIHPYSIKSMLKNDIWLLEEDDFFTRLINLRISMVFCCAYALIGYALGTFFVWDRELGRAVFSIFLALFIALIVNMMFLVVVNATMKGKKDV